MISLRPMLAAALLSALAALPAFTPTAAAQQSEAITNPNHDAELAKRLGADKRGMRQYVLVILKTGPTPVPPGPERNEMFAGHFANINRMAKEGQLVVAGPSDGVDGWRGIYVFATADIEEAKRLTATDPVIIKGEMVGEYHKWYGSAAMMEVNAIHGKLTRIP